MLKKFNTNLLNKPEKLLLAISGGIDSMVMLHNFYELSKTQKIKLMVAHVDHQKRESSSKDCAFVKETCQKLDIPFVSKALTYTENDNFHNYARTLRYEFFYNVAKKNGINKLVLAHNKNDNAETVLMRLTRGSSLEGYRGILDVSKYKDLTIIRPLLNVSRKEISEYQKQHNIAFREDESNAKDDYTRNRFRHHILPILEQENPKYLDKISQFTEYLGYAYNLVEKEAKDFIENHVTKTEDRYETSCAQIARIETILQIEVIKRIINLQTNNEIELSYQNLKDVITIIQNEKPHLELQFSDELYIYKSYDSLFIQSNPNIIKDYEFKVNSLGEIVLFDKEMMIISKNRSKYTGNIYKLCYNNLDQIFPITIRNRRDGDRLITPSGTKKLKDLFIDKKVPKTERDSIPIVLDKNNEIFWIPKYYSKKSNGNETIYLIYEKG